MGVRGVAFCLLPFLYWDTLLVPSLHPYIAIYLIRPSLYKYLSAPIISGIPLLPLNYLSSLPSHPFYHFLLPLYNYPLTST